MQKKNSKAMVFGVFDGIHEGHLHFLRSAAQYGSVLAVIAPDKAVAALKGHIPSNDEIQRLDAVKKTGYVHEAILGDEVQGTYTAISSKSPDCICIGYDQQTLQRDLIAWLERNNSDLQVVRLDSLRPDEFKSSLINGNTKVQD